MGFTSIVGVHWRRNDGAGLSALQMIGVGVDGDRWRKVAFPKFSQKNQCFQERSFLTVCLTVWRPEKFFLMRKINGLWRQEIMEWE